MHNLCHPEIAKPTFLIRENEEHDNSVVAECLLKGAENLGLSNNLSS